MTKKVAISAAQALIVVLTLEGCAPEAQQVELPEVTRQPDTVVAEPEPEAPPVVEPQRGPAIVPPERDGDLTAIEALGPLVVREGEYEAERQDKPEKKKAPWSSWWFPKRDRYLFERADGVPSPLEKYDQYMKLAHNIETRAAVYEKENLYEPDAVGWEGHCNAWALASIADDEPLGPLSRRGIIFTIGDLKALLIKTYEEDPETRRYGQRYMGNRESIYDDIYPDQLHRVMQVEMFEKGKPFIMDRDSGIAVWNHPVWKVMTRIQADASDPYRLHVTSWLFSADPNVDTYEPRGTKPLTFIYTYDLFGELDGEGNFHVAWGEWTNESLNMHPDFLVTLPDQPKRGSRNLHITPSRVDEILGIIR